MRPSRTSAAHAIPVLLLLALSGCSPRMAEWSAPVTLSATAEEPLSTWGGEWCAVRPDRSVTCWRQDSLGTFSDNGQLDVPADLGPVRNVSAGCSRACAARIDGTVACWGRTAAPPAGLGPARRVVAEDDSTCAILSGDSTLSCWRSSRPTQVVPAPSPGPVVDVSTGGQNWCALHASGIGACWGSPEWRLAAVPPGLGRLVALRAGWSVSCALDDQGAIGCVGAWSHQDKVPGASRLAVSLFSVGAVLPDRTLRCWKYDYY